jgi:hypothetical protein
MFKLQTQYKDGFTLATKTKQQQQLHAHFMLATVTAWQPPVMITSCWQQQQLGNILS